jgi:hypothetical protein
LPYYHISSSKLGPGSIIEPGNWGEIIKTFGWKHSAAQAEVALEHVRLTNFGHLPSRLACTYCLSSLEGGLAYLQHNQPPDGAMPHILYEVEMVDPTAAQHAASWRRVAPAGPLGLDWAMLYWRGDPHPEDPSAMEILSLSALRIVSMNIGRNTAFPRW